MKPMRVSQYPPNLFIISYRTIPQLTITLRLVFIPHMGSSTMVSAKSKTSFDTPYVSLPTTTANGNLYLISLNGLLRSSCSTTITWHLSFVIWHFSTASFAVGQYSHGTQFQVLMEAFLIRELGGASVCPQSITFSAAA